MGPTLEVHGVDQDGTRRWVGHRVIAQQVGDFTLGALADPLVDRAGGGRQGRGPRAEAGLQGGDVGWLDGVGGARSRAVGPDDELPKELGGFRV